jgi:flagellin
MSVINTNVKSLIAQQSLTVNNRAMGKTMEQLSTGKRINSAADDAAGLAIANKMTSQIRGLDMAVRNANDAISMIQTAEGSLGEVTNMLQRMRELAIQASNGTYSSTDRTSLDNEFTALETEITRISDKITWNGVELMGSAAAATSFQVGNATGDQVSVTFKDINSAVVTSSTLGGGVTTVATAASALSEIDTAITAVDTYRSTLGAMVNRLNYAADNLTNVSTNTSASRSRIMDTDYASATTELARSQIIQQAATAMLAQANQSPSAVLSLLQQ